VIGNFLFGKEAKAFEDVSFLIFDTIDSNKLLIGVERILYIINIINMRRIILFPISLFMIECERFNRSTIRSGCYCIVFWWINLEIHEITIFLKGIVIIWIIVLSIAQFQIDCCQQKIFSSKLYRFQLDIRLHSSEFFWRRIFEIVVGILLLSTPHRKLHNLCTHPFATVFSWDRHVVTSAHIDSIVVMVHVAAIHVTAIHVTAIHVITIHIVAGHHVIDSLSVSADVYSVGGNFVTIMRSQLFFWEHS